ncbi:MAG: histidinol-phosphate transaminase [Candidatus Kapaibacterium sp.]|jgi:histidinol-phosphate aminotransferase
MPIPVPEHILHLKAYRPGKPVADILEEYGLEEAIKLASNENPLGASPLAISAIERSLQDLASYPNGGKSLREALAKHYDMHVDEFIAGSGSEGVMNTVMRTFLQAGDEVLTSEGTFGGFYVLANALGLKLVLAPLRDYAYDLDAMADRITPNTRLIYIANPNNPTGSCFDQSAFDKFYARVPNHVIVLYDEAYYDFAIDEFANYPSLLAARLPNVITLRTFSKSHGLASIRIGFGVASPELIAWMLKVKLPFEPSGPGQVAGIAAIDDHAFLSETIAINRMGKHFLRHAFGELGIKFVDTNANFFCLVMEDEESAHRLVTEMERRGIIIRPLSGFGLPNCVRISIGTPAQNEKAVLAMTEVLEDIHSHAA